MARRLTDVSKQPIRQDEQVRYVLTSEDETALQLLGNDIEEIAIDQVAGLFDIGSEHEDFGDATTVRIAHAVTHRGSDALCC